MGADDHQHPDDTGRRRSLHLGRLPVRLFLHGFFLRFVSIFTIYKVYDMIFFDGFLLCRFRFFQHYFPEVAGVYNGRKYGYNLKSQLLKLLVIFPAASALAAWVCTLFYKYGGKGK